MTKTGHFTMYRRGDLSATHNETQANAASEPQFEGYVFSDGTCVLRWLTAVRSTSVWASFADAMAIHGHPEYGSQIVWSSDHNPLPLSVDEIDYIFSARALKALSQAKEEPSNG